MDLLPLPPDFPSLAERILGALIGGIYGTLGSLVHYLYSVFRSQHQEFKWLLFFVNGVLGFFIGQLVGSLLPETFIYRDGILLLSGFLVYQILDFIEANGLKIVIKKVFNLREDEKHDTCKK